MDKLNESWPLADGDRLCYRHCFRNLILIALLPIVSLSSVASTTLFHQENHQRQ